VQQLSVYIDLQNANVTDFIKLHNELHPCFRSSGRPSITWWSGNFQNHNINLYCSQSIQNL